MGDVFNLFLYAFRQLFNASRVECDIQLCSESRAAECFILIAADTVHNTLVNSTMAHYVSFANVISYSRRLQTLNVKSSCVQLILVIRFCWVDREQRIEVALEPLNKQMQITLTFVN